MYKDICVHTLCHCINNISQATGWPSQGPAGTRATLVAAGERIMENAVCLYFPSIHAVNLYFPKNLLYSGIYTKYVTF